MTQRDAGAAAGARHDEAAEPPTRWGLYYALVLIELALTIAALAWLTRRFT